MRLYHNSDLLFTEEYLISAILKDETSRQFYVSINITFPTDKPNVILGKLEGKYSDLCIICDDMNKYERSYSFESKNINDRQYFGENLRIIDYINNDYGEHIILKFEVGSFWYREFYSKSSTVIKDRSYKFQLSHPYFIWHACKHIADFEGELPDSWKERKKLCEFSIENYNFYFFEDKIYDFSYKGSDETKTYKIKIFINIEEKVESNLSDEELTKSVIKIFNRILLLTSFVATKNIIWYHYRISTNEYFEYHYKSIKNFNDNVETYFQILIDPDRFSEFIVAAYTEYASFLDRKINIDIPIKEYLTWEDAFYLEQKFLILCIAFEKVVNELVSTKDSNTLMGKDEFDKLKLFLKEQIDNFYSTETSENINKLKKDLKSKLKELNRLSFEKKSRKVLEKYNIPYESGLDNNGNLIFIKLRNTLTHTSDIDKQNELYHEFIRVKNYLEIIILKLLGYKHPIYKWNRYNEEFNKINSIFYKRT